VSRRRSIPGEIQEQVRRRARYLCEYCHTAEQWQYVRFTVDHVRLLAQGGTNALDNLALACFHCNRRKADRLLATDPHRGEALSLFNPRQHMWSDHFIWSANGLIILGLTPIGRATIAALELNRERAVNIRAADVAVGRHPPAGDPMQQTE
jgi:HNH endonuclease